MDSKQLINIFLAKKDDVRAKTSAWFFKCGKGQYGEGDVFLGIRVPEVRKEVNKFATQITLEEVEKLLPNKYHEIRLAGLLLLVKKYKTEPEAVFQLYTKNYKWINNWDLVDLTAAHIVGAWTWSNSSTEYLLKLAHSPSLWEKRVAMIATFYYLSHGNDALTYQIAEILKKDSQDLIQKAVGWSLREAGKRVSEAKLVTYLRKNKAILKRTTLRYAIERLSPSLKSELMSKN